MPDTYGIDSMGKIWKSRELIRGADPHRARYHSSVLGIENLNAGQEFNESLDTYTIFITEENFYGMGEPIYMIERMNLTTGKGGKMENIS